MRGHDVLTVQEAGNGGRATPDEEVLAFATAHGRAVITSNRRDFIRLHKTAPGHLGIIVCTQDTDFAGLAQRVHEQLTDVPHLNGRLVRVNRSG